MHATWHITPDADDASAYAALADDRAWTGYALADLEPPFRQYSHVALARRGYAPSAAACLVLRHPAFNAIVAHGHPHGLAAILSALDLPETASIAMRAPHRAAFARHYRFPAERLRAMQRMALNAETFRPPPQRGPGVERLGPADGPALLDLYAGYAESFFAPGQLDGGVFYGVREGGKLLAAGGTHVVSQCYDIAAVGNIYTRPAARGRGRATAITAAVVSDLLALPLRDIILNVAVANTTAIGIYRHLGFRFHCRFWEGWGERK